MESLAARHCKWGVRGVEYGIVGDVLFYALHHVLGDEAFNKQVQISWWRVYSTMLTHILPICIRHERDSVTVSTVREATVHTTIQSNSETKLVSTKKSEEFVIIEDA